MKLRRFFYLSGAFVLLLVKFAVDVVRKNIELEMLGLFVLREIAVVGAFVLVFLALQSSLAKRQPLPLRRIGILLLLSAVFLTGIILIGLLPAGGFDAKDYALSPLDYPSLFIASLIGLIAGVFATLLLRFLRDLVLVIRRKGTHRNFLILLVLVLATAASAAPLRPLDSSPVTTILFTLGLVFAVVNAFRLPWIVYLTKREKVLTLIFSFLLFVLLVISSVLLAQNTFLMRSLLYYSHPVREFVVLSLLFGAIYFGTAFVTTLFHLPTAEAFDRKRYEVSSIHTLSKLVTQVFDFRELVETVTTMTLQVCEASGCWLELLPLRDDGSPSDVDPVVPVPQAQIVSLKNITHREIGELLGTGLNALRATVLRDRKPAVVDALSRDPRFADVGGGGAVPGSLVVVPLVSHVGPVGFLYATKAAEYGFMKDDIDLISTFADQATIAIENSRLIEKSIERERFVREMTLAQEMQRKLLPQVLPRLDGVELEAVSTPAFEVGGDYYDFVSLPDGKLGIIVGDVSGKGVPAAFYMSEVKGIFQSIGALYASPRDFVIRANEVLTESIDKHSFVSVIYAILDPETGRLLLARAGHCPMVLVGAGGASYIRPDGMGLGLSEGSLFANAIEEHVVQLHPGDLCVFYTDGMTEAHRNGEEFGYERLLMAAGHASSRPAAKVKDDILHAVDTFIEHAAPHDDLTLVVVRWNGPRHSR